MRPIWNGTLAFGLVAIPVKLYAATEKKNIRFNLLHKEDGGAIKYLKVCSFCGKEVAPEDIVKGYEYRKGEYVLVEEEELESIPGLKAHVIDILDFVHLKDVDPVYFEKTYFLEPTEGAQKAYALLRESMVKEGKVAVAKVAIRSKETLSLVRVHNDKFLILETMFWADEVRLGEDLKVPDVSFPLEKREKDMAKSLIESLSVSFDPAIYESTQRAALLQLVEKKIKGQKVVTPKGQEAPKVIDLMEALKKSVEEIERQGKGKKISHG